MAREKGFTKKNFLKGIIAENPLFVSILGTCPALATTTSLEAALLAENLIQKTTSFQVDFMALAPLLQTHYQNGVMSMFIKMVRNIL